MQLSLSVGKIKSFLIAHSFNLVFLALVIISVWSFLFYLQNGLGLAYNDARSHLDISRRVVEGLKPGLAQLGSVWLPLTHLLAVPLIWNDFMWHSGLGAAVFSMISFVATGLLVFKILEKLNVGLIGRLVGVIVFVANINVLYLQATAMTELTLLATMTMGTYYLILWHDEDTQILHLIKAAFWIMLSTLVRYDGWFLLLFATILIFWHTLRKRGYTTSEGTILVFLTLSSFGIILWLLWNQLIFGDMLYFALGPFSAHSQQLQLLDSGNLPTKGDWLLSLKIYLYAALYNTYSFPAIMGFVGALVLWFDKKLPSSLRLATTALTAPFLFNVLALYLGFSVLQVQGISGETWFNIRYGMMLVPSIAVFLGYLVDKTKILKTTLIGLLAFVLFFAFVNRDAVTIDDAEVGSSQKNVTEVSGWLAEHASDKPGYILISVASHDAIIFSSGLPMARYIHEGTGLYWESALAIPDHWARWIIMRTYDDNDLTWKGVSKSPGFLLYNKVGSYPFADIYELKPEYVPNLNFDAAFSDQK